MRNMMSGSVYIVRTRVDSHTPEFSGGLVAEAEGERESSVALPSLAARAGKPGLEGPGRPALEPRWIRLAADNQDPTRVVKLFEFM